MTLFITETNNVDRTRYLKLRPL